MRPAFEMLVAPRGRDGAIPSVFQDGSLPASLLLHCCREVTPSAIMSASAPTNPDERYKREQCFRCPERARISWGKAMRGRGPGEGPNLIAFGATTHICALRTQFQSENVRRPEATNVPYRVAGKGRGFSITPKALRPTPRSG